MSKINRDILLVMLSVSLNKYAEDNVVTREMVKEHAKELLKLGMFSGGTDDDINYVCDEYEKTHLVKHELGKTIVNRGHKKWYLQRKTELDMSFWNAYKEHLEFNSKFPKKTIQTLDENLDNIVDLLGDPKSESVFHRKGMIIGDVQSGKTANYIGLMNKACDAGYNVIILLTGTIERLRQQTQERVDEGFIGKNTGLLNSINKKRHGELDIGVGRIKRKMMPTTLTTRQRDFDSNIARGILADVNGITTPVVLVIKKNTKIMNNLSEWLKSSLGIRQYINASLLMIDDECDYASVNTREDAEDLSATPKEITGILNMFERSSYVGFTATPYANIFIDPLTDREMEDEAISDLSLFPRDYIYCLNSSNQYIGPDQIFLDDAKYSYYLQSLGDTVLRKKDIDNLKDDDIRKIIPLKHKKNHIIDCLPSTLKEAIDLFFVANVIRDIKGDITKHRTMMVNVSRFISIQQNIGSLIKEYVDELQNEIRVYSFLDYEEAKSHFENFINTANKHYAEVLKEINIDNAKLIQHLSKSCLSITVKVVNSGDKENKLDYINYKDDGLRVIAVGGQSLSRGLTLEGLIISYFYRNSATYDTLMQMGRWFGYRPNYEKLCRIWMPNESISWYREITLATNELKDDIFKYHNTNLTPLDFGLRVRRTTTALLVTARNKMRTAQEIVQEVNVSEEVLEMKYLPSDFEKIKNNYNAFKTLVEECKDIPIVEMSGRKGYVDIPKIIILDFLNKLYIPDKNIHFINNAVNNFLSSNDDLKLEKWDVMFMSGDSKNTENINGNIFKHSLYSFKYYDSDNVIQLGKVTPKIGNNYDFAFGIKNQDKIKEHRERKGSPLSRKEYLSLDGFENRNPLLIIYNIDLKPEPSSENEKDIARQYNENSNLIAFVIGVPKLSESSGKFVKYVLNKVYLGNIALEEGDENDE